MLVILLIIIFFVSGQSDSFTPMTISKGEERIRLHEWLVIGDVGKYGRSAIHTDAIESQIVAGTWTPPKKDDRFIAPDGQARAWQSAIVAKDGWIRDPALRTGYAYTSVESKSPRKMLLEASGHSLVYVNGRPRAGDPYRTGWIRHPVELRKGTNHFLFLCRRGGVHAELVSPERDILFNERDTTLPDLVIGTKLPVWGAIPIINTTDMALDNLILESEFDGGSIIQARIPRILSMSTRKVGFRIPGSPPDGVENIEVRLRLLRSGRDDSHHEELDSTILKLRVRRNTEKHKCTFISDIDGSVQYFAVTPMHASNNEPGKAAMVLTLHGASVEALGQANAYGHKNWAHIVAPTNRRPYGFDWEDWGRWDALEVLAIAEEQFSTDSRRTYLTGHSMGGHGTWHLGSLFPDRFAAIAPSAGWISFRSYGNTTDMANSSPIDRMLRRAASPSDTLSRSHNLAATGVYILHGDKDDNVPVTEARTMRSHLTEFHADFAYYEQPGAGHWWGNECVDWAPLFDFLKHHQTLPGRDVRNIEFVTSNPAVSSTHHWATIVSQIEHLKSSSVDLHWSSAEGRVSGTTKNVSQLALDLAGLGYLQNKEAETRNTSLVTEPLVVQIDGHDVAEIPWPLESPQLWLEKLDDTWKVITKPSPSRKGPHRYGPFKEAFNRRFIFVYGTKGTREENEWAFNKARLDAETFWYRGNGAVDVVADHEFDPAKEKGRSVILYGHANSNTAWDALLSSSPVQVSRHRITIGQRTLSGGDFACLFVRPRPESDVALVGVVTGTDLNGLRLTDALPYFVSGVAYPDFIVMHKDILTTGTPGIMATGFFENDWSLEIGKVAWPAQQK